MSCHFLFFQRRNTEPLEASIDASEGSVALWLCGEKITKLIPSLVLCLLPLLLLAPLPIFAEDEEVAKSMRHAEINREAGLLSSSQELYQQQLDLQKPEWQQALTRYNLGATQLMMKRWEAAAEQFRYLNNDYTLPEEFGKKVTQQLGYALYLNAKEKQKNKNTTIDQLSALYHEAMEALDSNASDACCQPLIEAIQVSLGNMLMADEQRELESLNLRSKIQVLIQRTSQLISDLDLLTSASIQINLKELAQVYRSADDFWKTSLKMTPEQEKFFQQAAHEFHQSLDLLESNHIEEAKQTLVSTQKALESLRDLLPKAPFLDKLDEANDLLTYGRQMTVLPDYYQNNLSERLSALVEFKDLSESVQKQLTAAQKIFDLVIDSQTNQLYPQSHYYLLAASQRLTRAANEFKEKDRFSPIYILETAMHEQQNANGLVIMLEEIISHFKVNEEINELAIHVQSAVRTIAEHFTPVALVQQKAMFTGDDQAKQCQDKPWNEVFPLFYRGLNAAITAENYLEKTPIPYKLVSHYQIQAEKNWQEALAKLKKLPEQSKSLQPPPTSNENDEATQVLMEMDIDDQQLLPSPSNYKMVDRPW